MFFALWDVIEPARNSQRVWHGDSGVVVYSLLQFSIVYNVLGVSLLKNAKFSTFHSFWIVVKFVFCRLQFVPAVLQTQANDANGRFDNSSFSTLLLLRPINIPLLDLLSCLHFKIKINRSWRRYLHFRYLVDVSTIHFIPTNMVRTRVRGNLRMRKQNTKATVPLDVVPERRTKRFPPRFRPVGRSCELRFRWLSSPTGREGEISRRVLMQSIFNNCARALAWTLISRLRPLVEVYLFFIRYVVVMDGVYARALLKILNSPFWVILFHSRLSLLVFACFFVFGLEANICFYLFRNFMLSNPII